MTLFEGRRTLELYSQDIGCGFQECGDVLGKTSRLILLLLLLLLRETISKWRQAGGFPKDVSIAS